MSNIKFRTSNQKMLQIKNLKTYFFLSQGTAKAVDNVSLTLNPGETLALVGESGCGKSMLALSILRLVPAPGKIIHGQIKFNGQDLLLLSEKQMQKIRGNKISMIFQEPMTALNPVLRIGEQICEPLIYHQGLSRNQAREKALKLMQQVGIPDPEKRFFAFPHSLSGGMRQRIVIAMALSCSPKIILADEPTTALDVTIQAQILNLLQKMQKTNNMAIILITHDLGLVARTCQRVNVMYAGKIVEQSPVREIFNSPLHPYTQGLLDSLPRIDKDKKLLPIPGTVPDLLNLPSGCAFHPRCKLKKPICQQKEPPLFSYSQTRKVKCWLYHL